MVTYVAKNPLAPVPGGVRSIKTGQVSPVGGVPKSSEGSASQKVNTNELQPPVIPAPVEETIKVPIETIQVSTSQAQRSSGRSSYSIVPSVNAAPSSPEPPSTPTPQRSVEGSAAVTFRGSVVDREPDVVVSERPEPFLHKVGDYLAPVRRGGYETLYAEKLTAEEKADLQTQSLAEKIPIVGLGIASREYNVIARKTQERLAADFAQEQKSQAGLNVRKERVETFGGTAESVASLNEDIAASNRVAKSLNVEAQSGFVPTSFADVVAVKAQKTLGLEKPLPTYQELGADSFAKRLADEFSSTVRLSTVEGSLLFRGRSAEEAGEFTYRVVRDPLEAIRFDPLAPVALGVASAGAGFVYELVGEGAVGGIVAAANPTVVKIAGGFASGSLFAVTAGQTALQVAEVPFVERGGKFSTIAVTQLAPAYVGFSQGTRIVSEYPQIVADYNAFNERVQLAREDIVLGQYGVPRSTRPSFTDRLNDLRGSSSSYEGNFERALSKGANSPLDNVQLEYKDNTLTLSVEGEKVIRMTRTVPYEATTNEFALLERPEGLTRRNLFPKTEPTFADRFIEDLPKFYTTYQNKIGQVRADVIESQYGFPQTNVKVQVYELNGRSFTVEKVDSYTAFGLLRKPTGGIGTRIKPPEETAITTSIFSNVPKLYDTYQESVSRLRENVIQSQYGVPKTRIKITELEYNGKPVLIEQVDSYNAFGLLRKPVTTPIEFVPIEGERLPEFPKSVPPSESGSRVVSGAGSFGSNNFNQGSVQLQLQESPKVFASNLGEQESKGVSIIQFEDVEYRRISQNKIIPVPVFGKSGSGLDSLSLIEPVQNFNLSIKTNPILDVRQTPFEIQQLKQFQNEGQLQRQSSDFAIITIPVQIQEPVLVVEPVQVLEEETLTFTETGLRNPLGLGNYGFNFGAGKPAKQKKVKLKPVKNPGFKYQESFLAETFNIKPVSLSKKQLKNLEGLNLSGLEARFPVKEKRRKKS